MKVGQMFSSAVMEVMLCRGTLLMVVLGSAVVVVEVGTGFGTDTSMLASLLPSSSAGSLGGSSSSEGPRDCELVASIFNPSISSLELERLQAKLAQVDRSRDDAKTMCTADVIRTVTSGGSSKVDRVDEGLLDVLKSLYDRKKIWKLFPLCRAFGNVYTGLFHLHLLSLPLTVAGEVLRGSDRRCLPIYISLVSGEYAVIFRYWFGSKKRDGIPLSLADFCRQTGSVRVLLDKRVVAPISSVMVPWMVDRTFCSFEIAVEVSILSKKYYSNSCQLSGPIIDEQQVRTPNLRRPQMRIEPLTGKVQLQLRTTDILSPQPVAVKSRTMVPLSLRKSQKLMTWRKTMTTTSDGISKATARSYQEDEETSPLKHFIDLLHPLIWTPDHPHWTPADPNASASDPASLFTSATTSCVVLKATVT